MFPMAMDRVTTSKKYRVLLDSQAADPGEAHHSFFALKQSAAVPVASAQFRIRVSPHRSPLMAKKKKNKAQSSNLLHHMKGASAKTTFAVHLAQPTSPATTASACLLVDSTRSQPLHSRSEAKSPGENCQEEHGTPMADILRVQ